MRRRAETWQYLNEFELAWLDLQYALMIAPQNAQIYEGLGWLAIYQKDYPIAIRALEHAQSLNQTHTQKANLWIPLNLGLAHYLNHEQAKAYQIWQPLLGEKLDSDSFAGALKKDFQHLQLDGWLKETFTPAEAWLQQALLE